MDRMFVAAGLMSAALAGPALAGPDCGGREGAMMPMWQVAKTFEEAGGWIQQMKVSDGCYEIYGREGERRVEIYFDPQSGAVLEREED